MSTRAYTRPQAADLLGRLGEPRRFLQVLAGPRQVGKTTLVTQVVEQLDLPVRFISADDPGLRGDAWLEQQWHLARHEVAGAGAEGGLLVVDEVQKAPRWSETVKRLWDEDSRSGCPLKVVLLGSAPLLVQRGLTESLAGRFELLHLPHWSFAEMEAAFGWSLERFLWFGAYPGAAALADDEPRWARYVRDALVETTVSRDILLHTQVTKPALLRRVFDLACRYSGQVLSYTKMLGQLQEAGNTTTLAHYLDLLRGAGLVCGLQKDAGDVARSRGSSPKLAVFNTALMTATSGQRLADWRDDGEAWGRLVESAVGAHLVNAAAAGLCDVRWWRHRQKEVDFVLRRGSVVVGLEVKSGRAPVSLPGMAAFSEAFAPTRTLLVGGDGVPVEDFLRTPVEEWLRP